MRHSLLGIERDVRRFNFHKMNRKPAGIAPKKDEIRLMIGTKLEFGDDEIRKPNVETVLDNTRVFSRLSLSQFTTVRSPDAESSSRFSSSY